MAIAHRTRESMDAELDRVEAAPTAVGRLELIAARPRENERKLLSQGTIDVSAGLVGDNWHERPASSSADGGPNPEAQITVMSARAARLVTGIDDHGEWAMAGDQLYVDMDLSEANLPAGTRLQIGEAILEVTAEPHLGCGKFSRRFGVDALKMVNSERGRALRLRGLNSRVVRSGAIAPGDEVRRLGGD